MEYVIGVDGGATKTFALVAQTNGTIVGFGKSGCGSYEMAGIETAKSNILEAVEQALYQRNISKSEVELGCFALAGADFYPEDFELLEKAMKELGVAKRLLSEMTQLLACVQVPSVLTVYVSLWAQDSMAQGLARTAPKSVSSAKDISSATSVAVGQLPETHFSMPCVHMMGAGSQRFWCKRHLTTGAQRTWRNLRECFITTKNR